MRQALTSLLKLSPISLSQLQAREHGFSETLPASVPRGQTWQVGQPAKKRAGQQRPEQRATATWCSALNDVQVVRALTREIADGGEAFPAGVREIANRIHADLDGKEMTLRALVERTFGE